MNIEPKGEYLFLHLDCGKIFMLGVRGSDKLVVALEDADERRVNSELVVYREGEGESKLGEVRHIVLE